MSERWILTCFAFDQVYHFIAVFRKQLLQSIGAAARAAASPYRRARRPRAWSCPAHPLHGTSLGRAQNVSATYELLIKRLTYGVARYDTTNTKIQ